MVDRPAGAHVMLWVGMLVGAFTVSASVEVDAPKAPCPWASLIPASLERLDTVTVTATAAVHVAVRVEGEHLALELVEAGRTLAARRLPADGACDARADGVALVVEQQLQDLGYVPRAPPVPPTRTATRAAPPPDPPPPPPGPPPDPAPPPVLVAVRSATVTPAATSTGAAWSLWARAGGYLEVGAEALGVRGGARIDLEARYGRFALLFTATGLAPKSTEVVPGDASRGTMRVWGLGFTVGGEACFERAYGDLCGAARLGLERAEGTAEGDLLFGEGTQARVAPLVGGGVRYRYRFLGRFSAWLAAEGVVRPAPIAFAVEDAVVVEDPGLALGVSLGVSAKIF